VKRAALALALAALCAASAGPSAAAGLGDYTGFWNGQLQGFRGKYRVTLTVSGLNKSYYGSYSVLPPKGAASRGTFSFEPGKNGCWGVRLNAPGGAPLRVPEFCPRPGGGVVFYVDGAELSVIAETRPGTAALDIIVSHKHDELRGTIGRKTPRGQAAEPAKAEPPPPSVPLLNAGEKPVRAKRPPKL